MRERRDYRLKSMEYQVRSKNRIERLSNRSKLHAEIYSPYYLETFEASFEKDIISLK